MLVIKHLMLVDQCDEALAQVSNACSQRDKKRCAF